jgi:hypothetical protein
MKNFNYIGLWMLLVAFLGSSISLSARNPETSDEGRSDQRRTTVNLREDCAQATGQIDQQINNIRARLLNGGDVWWDLNGNGRYIVPKVEPGSGEEEVSSIFAGSVWLGGFDDQGNLRMAANTYRSATSNDFYPGPLTPEGTTTPQVCENWDQFFKVTGEEIQQHLRNVAELGDAYSEADIPDGIKYWPAKGNPYFIDRYGFELPNLPQGLGSYKDFGPGFDEFNPDGTYNPLDGDFPVIEIRGCELEQYPDEMIFWIYNDAAGPHTETEATPIRMEVQVQAFAYSTNDEINNMTFQRYKLINRAETSLDSTYFAMWVDGDLGCDGDDFIGCDTSLSLMYLYNQDEVDGDVGSTAECQSGARTYGFDVPILGVDYFRGPLGPKVFAPDGSLRNPRLGETVDTIVELGMSAFTYYNRNGGPGGWPAAMTDPQNGVEYYNYLSGSWRDGTPFTFGGSAYQSGGRQIDYAFTEPPTDQNGWSMCTANLALGDRRTIQASGPFRLDPGAFNELIIGVVWVPDLATYPCPDLTSLIRADVKAQALFDACFDILDGPDAPDLGVIELDREVIFTFSNDTITSNNKFLSYSERGLDIPKGEADTTYDFEGYRLYQLAGPDVDPQADGTLENVELARPVLQVDIRNNVSTIWNWEAQADPFEPSQQIYTPTLMVEGNNDGITNSFVVQNDAFGSSGERLVNHTRYFYTVIAYAYNNYDTFDISENLGQATAYIEGRRNVRTYEVIPRPTPYTDLRASYGEGSEVIRLAGEGAGNNFLRVSREMREQMLSDTFSGRIVYEERSAPIDVKVFNPYEIEDGDYLVEFFDDNMDDDVLDPMTGKFRVIQLETGNSFTAETGLDKTYEQLIPNWGLSVFARNREAPGNILTETNGAIGSEVVYTEDGAEEWFGFWPENQFFNFIKTDGSAEPDFELDPNRAFSEIITGPLYPMGLMDYREPEDENEVLVTPAWFDIDMSRVRAGNPISNLNNVDIVLTSDRSKWSKCIVVETANQQWRRAGYETVGGARNLDVRRATSRGIDADPATGEPVLLPNEPEGFSYFPGYAVDVETGQRLNIFFGENSVYSTEELTDSDFPDSLKLGGDMIFNPTSDVGVNTNSLFPLSLFLGGHHMVYVTNQPYDGCESLRDDMALDPGESSFLHKTRKRTAMESVQWGGLIVLPEGQELTSYEEGLIPSEVTVSMRVDQPYKVSEDADVNNGYPTYRFTIEGAEPRELASTNQVDSALDFINVVPNPYYAFSDYEVNSFVQNVKITNLPPECTVTIYSLEGKFIRQYKRNEQRISNLQGRTFVGVPSQNFVPDILWDLRNSKGIPIAAGVYLIHVDAPGLGERTIKWFGVNRQFDPAGL